HFQPGRPDEAFLTQSQALALMRTAHLPANLPRDWLLKAERSERDLFRLRRAEPATPSGPGGRPSDHLDRLFPETAFSQPDPRTEAIALVQQLLLWLPDDTRLYWLLGELYRADGDLKAAAQ